MRRKPLHTFPLQQQFDISPKVLAQLMEDNARRRLQQQFEQQLELINMQMNHQRHRQHQLQNENYNHQSDNDESDPVNDPRDKISNEQYDNLNADFTYKFPVNGAIEGDDQDSIPFAVDPSDPRFYALNPPNEDSYEEYNPEDRKTSLNSPEAIKNLDGTNIYHRAQSSSSAANLTPMKPVQNVAPSNSRGRNDINALIEKLQKEGDSGVMVNSEEVSKNNDEHIVLRQHLGIGGEVGMYLVALIAGISAAITVGVIALGIAWYTYVIF